MSARTHAVVSLFLVAALGGCGSKRPEPAPAPAPAATPSTSAGNGGTTSSGPSAPAPGNEAENARLAEAARVRTVLEQRIHFDYDRADLSQDARRVLAEKLPVLRQYPAIRLVIEGHADERGSDEYNLALGTRRAAAVVTYLAAAGVDRSRLEVVSFGEERPLVVASTESAWAQNRRDEFRIVSGLNAP